MKGRDSYVIRFDELPTPHEEHVLTVSRRGYRMTRRDWRVLERFRRRVARARKMRGW